MRRTRGARAVGCGDVGGAVEVAKVLVRGLAVARGELVREGLCNGDGGVSAGQGHEARQNQTQEEGEVWR